MVEWNEQRLDELVRKMKLRRTPGQGESPIHLSLYGTSHLSLYGTSYSSHPLLAKTMRLDANTWSVLGYTETDRVSLVRYLGSLGCRADGALSAAAYFQRPLTLELAKALIDAGAFDKEALGYAANYQQPLTLELAKLLVNSGALDKRVLLFAVQRQHPLTLELAKLLIDAGCDSTLRDGDGWDSLVYLAYGGHPVDPQVTDLFLSAGCRTNLDGCTGIFDEHRLRFDQILQEHAEWKENLDRMSAENSSTDTFYGPDWGR